MTRDERNAYMRLYMRRRRTGSATTAKERYKQALELIAAKLEGNTKPLAQEIHQITQEALSK